MSEQELNAIIASNISSCLEKSGKAQIDLADYMGVSQATVSNWCKGTKLPRMDKIDRICQFFSISRSTLMSNNSVPSYYLDPAAAEIAQEVYDRPELKVLFDASRKVSKEDLQAVISLIDRMKKDEKGE